MAQKTTGLKALLNVPSVYRAQQYLWGAPKLRAVTCSYLGLQPNQSLLDVGCGPADILSSLSGINYFGVDVSPKYIAAARVRFNGRGKFFVGDVYSLPELADRRFDAVLAQGVLHHIDDSQAAALFRFATQRLVPGGRIVTADPCYHEHQGMLERFLIDHDRGQNVRRAEAYRDLARAAFEDVRCELRSDAARFPYTYCYVIATRGTDGSSSTTTI